MSTTISSNIHLRENPKFFKRFIDNVINAKWMEKYDAQITKVWKYVPENIAQIVTSVAIFLLGISINGDWINIFVHVSKQYRLNYFVNLDYNAENFHLQNYWTFLTSSLITSYTVYFLIGGFLHWYYYVNQRNNAKDWKCQPTKWASPEIQLHEITLGMVTLFFNAASSALLACYISNGGYSKVYYDISEYGWLWFFLQFPVIFILQDYVTYWLHRMYHFPFFYKHFHKLHHTYKQPTAFSVTALHPVESVHIQLTLALPLFFMPLHWLPFYTVVFYTYYHGIISHSGINFKSFWWQPWQPDVIFHDNHHQYFHVNFAFNIYIWDKLHGTFRQKNRIYRENIFYGEGKSLDLLNEQEMKEEVEERLSENPLAYRDQKEYEALLLNEKK